MSVMSQSALTKEGGDENALVTYRIDGKHDPLLFLPLKSSSLLLPQLHLICNNTPLSSFLLQRRFTSKEETPSASFPLYSSSLFAPCPSFTLFFSSLFSLFMLSKVRAFDLLWHIRNHRRWVKAVLASKMSTRDRGQVCV